jgi:hypothetical protein
VKTAKITVGKSRAGTLNDGYRTSSTTLDLIWAKASVTGTRRPT